MKSKIFFEAQEPNSGQDLFFRFLDQTQLDTQTQQGSSK